MGGGAFSFRTLEVHVSHANWLFGFLAGQVDQLKTNLLDPGFENKKDPIGFTRFIAMRRFWEQTDSYFQRAGLRIRKIAEEDLDYGTHYRSKGKRFRTEVEAVSRHDDKPTYSDHVDIVAAPHGGFKECRRGRRDWGR